jgi:hypothetical protein
MGFNLGKFLGGIGKGIGKIAPLAAPFIPGIGGVVAGALGGILSGNDAQKQADAAYGQQSGIAQQQAALLQKYGVPALDNLQKNFADPNNNAYSRYAQGSFSPGAIGERAASIYSPVLGTIEANYGDQVVNERAGKLFDPSQLTSGMINYQESGDQAYENAIREAKADLGSRGFFSPNTLESSAISSIRQAQGADNASSRRNMIANLLAEKRGYVGSNLGQGAALRTNLSQNQAQYTGSQYDQGEAIRQQGISSAASTNDRLFSAGSNSAQGAMGTFGGLGGMYGSQAETAQKGAGDLLGAATKAGLKLKLPKINLGNIFKGRPNPRAGSTSVGPVQGPQQPWYNYGG